MLFLCSISFFAQLNSKCISNRLFSFVTCLYFEKRKPGKMAKQNATYMIPGSLVLCIIPSLTLAQLYKLTRKNTLLGKRCALKSIGQLIPAPWALPLKG